jgi:hypothetical protein
MSVSELSAAKLVPFATGSAIEPISHSRRSLSSRGAGSSAANVLGDSYRPVSQDFGHPDGLDRKKLAICQHGMGMEVATATLHAR